GAEDVVLDLALVGVEELAPNAGDGERMDLAQEDAASVELMAAQLGHQPAARSLVEPPVAQLGEALVQVVIAPLLLRLLHLVGQEGLERLPILFDFLLRLGIVRDELPPAVLVGAWDDVALVVEQRDGVVAVPKGADVTDLAKDAGGHHL